MSNNTKTRRRCIATTTIPLLVLAAAAVCTQARPYATSEKPSNTSTNASKRRAASPPGAACLTEWQIVRCGDAAPDDPKARAACCAAHASQAPPPPPLQAPLQRPQQQPQPRSRPHPHPQQPTRQQWASAKEAATAESAQSALQEAAQAAREDLLRRVERPDLPGPAPAGPSFSRLGSANAAVLEAGPRPGSSSSSSNSSPLRVSLNSSGSSSSDVGGPPPVDYGIGDCTEGLEVKLPVFGPFTSDGDTVVRMQAAALPKLPRSAVLRVRRAALAAAPAAQRERYDLLVDNARRVRAPPPGSSNVDDGSSGDGGESDASASVSVPFLGKVGLPFLPLLPFSARRLLLGEQPQQQQQQQSQQSQQQQSPPAQQNSTSTPLPFHHPGGYAGAAELALMAARLGGGAQPQAVAKEALLSGAAAPLKLYGGWAGEERADGYGGPYAMEVFEADYGGVNVNETNCPPNYPEGAPRKICGHVAFAELDAEQAYKQALAYAATGDARYAEESLKIMLAWATTNRVWGVKHKNGPLEAAWGIASMARAMELLRATWPALTQDDLGVFLGWVDRVLMPQMDWYVDEWTPKALAAGKRNVYGNWHASIADAYVALGVLADDVARYEKGVELARTTLRDYLKWGIAAAGAAPALDGSTTTGDSSSGSATTSPDDFDTAGRARPKTPPRLPGEATETLRDIYHTLFGLGSLVQAAETAFVARGDAFLYEDSNAALATALELHARIVSARAGGGAGDAGALPDGFKFFDAMPAPPQGCGWRWDIETQLWSSYDADGAKCSDLQDGVKYLVGVTYIPAGYELAYNHYAGRLGLRMPETAALLRVNAVDWFEMCWGLATLTHAASAAETWRPGLSRDALCPARRFGGGGNEGGA